LYHVQMQILFILVTNKINSLISNVTISLVYIYILQKQSRLEKKMIEVYRGGTPACT